MKSFLIAFLFTVLIILLVIIFIYIVYNRISKKYYGFCPKCSKEFTASPLQLIFTVHVFNKFYLKCPHCGYLGLKQFEKIKK